MKGTYEKLLGFIFAAILAHLIYLPVHRLAAGGNRYGFAGEDLVLAEELESMLPLAEKAGEAEPAAASPPSVLQPMSVGNTALTIPAIFAVTRPEGKLQTPYDHYFITGTSDPSQPVSCNGEPVRRLGAQGAFGVYVPLDMGLNTFTLHQGGERRTVAITRIPVPENPPIQDIVQGSMVPAASATVKNGEMLSVGCIAPSGAAIQAAIGSKAVTLKQAKEDIPPGLPAVFTGKLTVKSNQVPPDETAMSSGITYTMEYLGGRRTFASSGNVYIVGESAEPVVEVTGYLGLILPDPGSEGIFKETVKAGARDRVVSQSNEYYELASGGFISKKQVRVVLGNAEVKNRLKCASFVPGAKWEKFVFYGTRSPAYNTWIADNTFFLHLYNTHGTPRPDVSGSRLVSSCSVQAENGGVLYRFPLSGPVWGVDVAFCGGDTTLTLRYKPSLSADADTPLSGLTVVLDPGHGGTDPGALGVAGKTGPAEAEVNLANALAVRDRLRQLGADVVMTREDDRYLSLDDRLKRIEEADADLFVSLHHNSILENIDANKVSGMEIYYHTALSKPFAHAMMGGLSHHLNRNNRLVEQSYYRVTLMHHSPALLVELGFLSNPLEYEKAVDAGEMQKVANAVSEGILKTLDSA